MASLQRDFTVEIFRGMLQFFFGKAISEIALTTRKGSLFTWSGRESYNRAGGGGADEYNSLF